MEQTPSVGRIVIYYCSVRGANAAIITSVHSNTCVNLACFDGNGNPYNQTSVTKFSENQVNNCWDWPPRV